VIDVWETLNVVSAGNIIVMLPTVILAWFLVLFTSFLFLAKKGEPAQDIVQAQVNDTKRN